MANEIAIIFKDETDSAISIEMLSKEPFPKNADDLSNAERQAMQAMEVIEKIAGKDIRQLQLVPVDDSNTPILDIHEHTTIH